MMTKSNISDFAFTITKAISIASITLIGLMLISLTTAYADIVQNDDLIVEGSVCASDEDACFNGESFSGGGGVAEFKAKDNFPVIWLDDTDAGDADWGIGVDASPPNVADQAFYIRNDETVTIPFQIENGAGNHLLYLDAAERIGINTNVPAYTVDAIGNRIRLRNSTAFNARTIWMRTDGAAAEVRVDDNGPKQKRGMFVLENNGAPSFRFNDTSIGRTWEFSMTNLFPEGNFVINEINVSGREFFLNTAGDGVFKGTVTADNYFLSSDRNLKNNIEPLDGRDVLSKVMELPISSWSFKDDSDKQRHIGPMAQDFQKIFGGAPDDRHISVTDSSGIALAAIQGLGELVKAKDAQIAKLQKELDDLKTMVHQIAASDQVAMVQ